mmetsp:Transcript_5668/g.11017  ORF Transcript_5668/g.11017 Transcript_5668/m.11017 type:complete len:207 (+) Transcript_5668:232-852(+)|eukprot:CAMPEP_0173381840 /NCGR_PEP_ID=MMETSP1356-20130122/4270_1 /TAXON_ID=77927 ORGANISM="Hemiselmis virescens, Strain PCC157" /NCGR_SAMPLE_ID=MMETSP1356 /ASSEMBLY_ACC=CAM_ASM_000847 /LENGTH=206 /DNA_ID=CAMNT_0014335869 /DNA_START=237 /DNA_END=857 /DNA_ORIENTATION=+
MVRDTYGKVDRCALGHACVLVLSITMDTLIVDKKGFAVDLHVETILNTIYVGGGSKLPECHFDVSTLPEPSGSAHSSHTSHGVKGPIGPHNLKQPVADVWSGEGGLGGLGAPKVCPPAVGWHVEDLDGAQLRRNLKLAAVDNHPDKLSNVHASQDITHAYHRVPKLVHGATDKEASVGLAHDVELVCRLCVVANREVVAHQLVLWF